MQDLQREEEQESDTTKTAKTAKTSQVIFHLLNLKERPDRLDNSIVQLESIIFPPDVEIVIKVHQQRRRTDGNGKLGCFLGHRSIWCDIAKQSTNATNSISGTNNVKLLNIICEDDISVDSSNFYDAVKTAFDETGNWDIFCFGWFPLSTRKDKQNDHLRRIRFGGMAHCYAISSSWAKEHCVSEYPGYNHDLWMFMDKKSGWNVVGYVPMVAFQSDQNQNLLNQQPISDISPRMYHTRSLWWRICPLDKTLSMSEKSTYFVWLFVLVIVILILLIVRKRKSNLI